MAAAQFVEAGRQLELSKIPLFFGDPAKDHFQPDTWLQRLEQARQIGNWNAINTAIYMNMAFRENAIKWRDGLHEMGINTNDWPTLRAEFLRFYAPSATIRSCVANLDLKQGSTESVRDYGPRVAKVIHDIKSSAPDYVFPAQLFAPAIANIADVAALAQDVRENAHRDLVSVGEKRLADLVSVHIFVAGLKPYLRDKCVTEQFATYYDAYTHATQLEHNMADPRKSQHVTKVDLEKEPQECDSDPEIAELEQQLNAMKFRKRQKQFGNRRNPNQRRTYNNPGNTPRRDYSGYKCHYCHIPGHLQQVCRKRLAAGAPMVPVPPPRQPPKRVDEIGETQGTSTQAPPGNPALQYQYFNPFQGDATSSASETLNY